MGGVALAEVWRPRQGEMGEGEGPCFHTRPLLALRQSRLFVFPLFFLALDVKFLQHNIKASHKLLIFAFCFVPFVVGVNGAVIVALSLVVGLLLDISLIARSSWAVGIVGITPLVVGIIPLAVILIAR